MRRQRRESLNQERAQYTPEHHQISIILCILLSSNYLNNEVY